MDVVFVLVAVVCIEVAVMSLGLFWYLPRAINQAFVEAEDMIERQKAAVFAEAAEFVKALLCKENIEALTTTAAPILSAHLRKAAGGIASGVARRAAGDLANQFFEGALNHFLGGAASAAPPEEGGGGGVAPPAHK